MNVWTLFVVSVTRQKELRRWRMYQESLKRLVTVATYGSISSGSVYSSSSRRKMFPSHSTTDRNTRWSFMPHAQSP